MIKSEENNLYMQLITTPKNWKRGENMVTYYNNNNVYKNK